jgi:hypothetical protein
LRAGTASSAPPSPARHGGCKKRQQPPRRLPSPATRARDFQRGGGLGEPLPSAMKMRGQQPACPARLLSVPHFHPRGVGRRPIQHARNYAGEGSPEKSETERARLCVRARDLKTEAVALSCSQRARDLEGASSKESHYIIGRGVTQRSLKAGQPLYFASGLKWTSEVVMRGAH